MVVLFVAGVLDLLSVALTVWSCDSCVLSGMVGSCALLVVV